MIEDILLFLISLISNIFSAFSGGGAGVIQLPAILLLYEIAFISALASHKIATVALGVGATIKFLKEIKFNYNFIYMCLIIGIPSVITGAKSITLVQDSTARTMLGILIILIAIYSFFSKKFGEESSYKKYSVIKENINHNFYLIDSIAQWIAISWHRFNIHSFFDSSMWHGL